MESVTNSATTYTNLLSSLKPAATKLILDSNTKLPELLKLTLLNLVLNEVLVIRRNPYETFHDNVPPEEQTIIETGKNYAEYTPDAFEMCFLCAVNTNIYYKLVPYITRTYLRIESTYKYKQLIINSSGIEHLFSFTKFNSFIRYIQLSSTGKLYRNNFSEYFHYVMANINTWIEKDINKAHEVTAFLKGNIFLIKGINLQHIKTLINLIPCIPDSNIKPHDGLSAVDLPDTTLFSIHESFSICSGVFDCISDSFDDGDGSDGDGGDGGGDGGD